MQTKNLQIYSQYNNLTKRQKHERTERVFFLIDHFLKIMKLQKDEKSWKYSTPIGM